ncbi:hypothetical protein JKX24_15655 [Serratia proteamaculans]|uniref:Uncharacterized protein n=1 Tax=Serratia proteamaculans TaxID=28151 RepID=A0A7U0N340_SERPR|nr:hypothetical protein [Serratia proteamaculans]MBO1504875.1 hypothetical protein [Serratia proteamaculans]MDW5511901.1 hypothetical protein [Serratia proteamaculans]QQX51645.1 hypothetical protein JKX24_15655 [Serratia proteamaculans]
MNSFFSETLSLISKYGNESNNFGALFSALTVVFIIYIINKFLTPTPNLSGVIYMKSITSISDFNPYIGLTVFHTLTLSSNNLLITGTSEKTGEIDKHGFGNEKIGEKRTLGKINGNIEKKLFSRNVIHVMIIEGGITRNSTIYISFKRKLCLTKKYIGTFKSTAADSVGSVTCQKKKFSEHPSLS